MRTLHGQYGNPRYPIAAIIGNYSDEDGGHKVWADSEEVDWSNCVSKRPPRVIEEIEYRICPSTFELRPIIVRKQLK